MKLMMPLLFGVFATGCLDEESPAPETACDPEHAECEALDDDLQAAACPAGFHPHTVQWNTRAPAIWGQCDASSPFGYSFQQGRYLCMESSNRGYSCGGNWYVPVYDFTYGYPFVRIDALH